MVYPAQQLSTTLPFAPPPTPEHYSRLRMTLRSRTRGVSLSTSGKAAGCCLSGALLAAAAAATSLPEPGLL